uniref:Myc box-dependent-interacting protein 1 n=1 Tax=Salmo trutta TaxID=8032 RepID=A0A674B2A3_SALTR
MAEEQGKTGKGINTGKLATNMQKRLSRAQEKVLQKLGKADETRDTAFEEGVANFNKQMAEGTKLQKDLRAYLAAVKTMHDASKRLQDCLADMYEPEWFGKEEVDTIAEETDILWSDYHDKLVDNSMIAMDTYLAQFPDVKARIAKRDRKMTDYDSARHHFGSLQKGKKQDQAKIAKAEEELGRAQKVFEEINVDLQDELPQLWNSRVGFYVNTFQSMAGYQQRFHKDMGKVRGRAGCLPSKDGSKAPSSPEESGEEDRSWNKQVEEAQGETTAPSAPESWTTVGERRKCSVKRKQMSPVSPLVRMEATEKSAMGGNRFSCFASGKSEEKSEGDPGSAEETLLSQSGSSFGSSGLAPSGVKAMHDYAATDGDELEMKAGDVVLVLAWENPDEQDDGWLMGVKESHWLENKDLLAKGVFPENFTQKL